jgi:hypothetical protein
MDTKSFLGINTRPLQEANNINIRKKSLTPQPPLLWRGGAWRSPDLKNPKYFFIPFFIFYFILGTPSCLQISLHKVSLSSLCLGIAVLFPVPEFI